MTRSNKFKLSAALAGVLALSACGDTAGEQLLYGAAVGGVGSAVVGGDVTTGIAAGAVANTLYCQQLPVGC